jgi:hypothetical protein
MRSDLGIVVLSCDKYSDLWQPCFAFLFRAWPDCPFNVYLAANQKRFEHKKVTTLLSGEDTDWSSSVRRSVAQVAEDNVLFLYDDAFLTGRVSTESVAARLSWFLQRSANYLRMRSLPRPDQRIDSLVGLIRPGSAYRTALFTSVWRKAVILDILRDGETAWAFELHGLKRAEAYDGFYGTYEQVFPYIHGVEKGKWFPWAVWYLRHHGFEPDVRARPMMSPSEAARYLTRLPSYYLIQLLPTSMWPKVFSLKRSLRNSIRLP